MRAEMDLDYDFDHGNDQAENGMMLAAAALSRLVGPEGTSSRHRKLADEADIVHLSDERQITPVFPLQS